MNKEMKFFAERRYRRNVAIYGGYERPDGMLSTILKPEIKTHDAIEMTDPFLELKEAEAQALFDTLWQVGFRPADGTGNSGHTAALQYHLEDMRKLVFKGEK